MNNTKTNTQKRAVACRLLGLVTAAVFTLGVLAGCTKEPEPAPIEVEPSVLAEVPTTAPDPTAVPTATASAAAQVMLPEMAELYAENPDIVGWIQIEGTEIDYPVMYTPQDGQFYLYRNFDGEEDPTQEGCLFVDEHCSVDPRSTNLLIHGHNMKNGTMFHTLIDYKEEDFYKEHPVITYKTLYEQQQYEIAYVFLSKVYNVDDDVWKFYKFYEADNAEQYDDFTEHCKELELYDTGVTAQYDDDLITLTTCEYSTDNGRMVVVARRVTEEFPLQGEAAIQSAEAQGQTVEGSLSED